MMSLKKFFENFTSSVSYGDYKAAPVTFDKTTDYTSLYNKDLVSDVLSSKEASSTTAANLKIATDEIAIKRMEEDTKQAEINAQTSKDRLDAATQIHQQRQETAQKAIDAINTQWVHEDKYGLGDGQSLGPVSPKNYGSSAEVDDETMGMMMNLVVVIVVIMIFAGVGYGIYYVMNKNSSSRPRRPPPRGQSRPHQPPSRGQSRPHQPPSRGQSRPRRGGYMVPFNLVRMPSGPPTV